MPCCWAFPAPPPPKHTISIAHLLYFIWFFALLHLWASFSLCVPLKAHFFFVTVGVLIWFDGSCCSLYLIITHLLKSVSLSAQSFDFLTLFLCIFPSLWYEQLTQDVLTITACSLTCKTLPVIYSNASLSLSTTVRHVPCKIHGRNKM